MSERDRISGKEATKLALEGSKRGPVQLEPPANDAVDVISLPPVTAASEMTAGERKPPPRVRKPSPTDDRCIAPTPDLEAHQTRLREALGNTLADEFVHTMLGQLVQALRPSPFDHLEEATLNAALAMVCSAQPRSEFEAQIAIQAVAVGFAGMRFLRLSQRQLTEDYIDVYGAYAIKLLKLQNDLIQTLDRHRRGNTQTVEIRHVHVHAGGQAAVGIINPPQGRGGSQNE
jgi:hypothetical protein